MNELEQFDKEARMLWTSAAEDNPQFLDNAVKGLARAEDRFMNRIRTRDAIESGTALIMMAVLLPAAWWSVSRREWWFAAAFAWGALYAAGVILWLWRARRTPPADPSLPLEDYRHRVVARVDAQIALIRSVRWWYVAPVAVFCALIYGAVLQSIPDELWPKLWARRAFKVHLLLLPAATIAVCWFVIRLNEGQGLRSLREERARLLGSDAMNAE